jgi:hypothetical protein
MNSSAKPVQLVLQSTVQFADNKPRYLIYSDRRNSANTDNVLNATVFTSDQSAQHVRSMFAGRYIVTPKPH